MKKIESHYYEGYKQDLYGRDVGVYDEIEAEKLFTKVLKEHGLYDRFVEEFKSSDQVLMRELAKTYLINLTNIADYKVDTLWLQTGKSLETAFDLVKFYDYSIVRRKAPILSLKYVGKNTLTLGRGVKIGTYKGYDIINMDNIKYLEYGDTKDFYLGHYQEETVAVTPTNEFKVEVKPKKLLAVDQENIFIMIGEEELSSTKFISEYIKGEAFRDFSNDNSSTVLYLQNKTYQYGLHEKLKNTPNVKIQYLETDGLLNLSESVDINEVKLTASLKDTFEGATLGYKGYNGDGLETLRTYAPLVSSTKGNAVSLKHYKTLTAFITDFYDTNPFKEKGRGESLNFEIVEESAPISFKIESQTFTSKKGLDEEVLKEVKEVMKDFYTLFKINDKTFTVYTNNSKAKNNFSGISNLNLLKREPSIKSQCCVLMCPYVRFNLKEGLDTRTSLTEVEERKVWEDTRKFKSWGVDLRYYPAKKVELPLKIELQINKDISYNEEIQRLVESVFNSYSYKIGMTVPIPEIVTRLSNLKVMGEKLGSRFIMDMASAEDKINGKVFTADRDSYFVLKPEIVYKTWKS